MATVIISSRELFEPGLKSFLLLCKKEGIMRDYRDNSFFMSGTEKRKLKNRRAVIRKARAKR